MKRPVEGGLALAAVILTAAFMAGFFGWGRHALRGSGPPTRAGFYYHAGKAPPAHVEEGGCRAPKCHTGFPHAKVRTQAAFRNMHLRFVDCLACHAKDARKSWVAEPLDASRADGSRGSLRTRWKIALPAPAVSGEEMHALIGPALSCRACHSEEGQSEIAAKGIKDLPAGFADPVPLRMIEEGARQWIPDTMR